MVKDLSVDTGRTSTSRTKMGIRKEILITTEYIDLYVPGDSTNNPISHAMKKDAFRNANEIIVHADEIWIDGQLIIPTLQMTRWVNDWNNFRKVSPSILGYRVAEHMK